MRTLVIVLVFACGNKTAQQGQGSGSAAAVGSAAVGSAAIATGSGSAAMGSGSAVAAGNTGSAVATGSAGSAATGSAGSANAFITASNICCCESSGDATHDTIEGEPAVCSSDEMHNGDCIALDSCKLDASVKRLDVDAVVTVDNELLAVWKTGEAKAYGALRIKIDGKKAKLTVNGSDDNGFKKGATIPVTGAITVTAKADGTAVIGNGAGTWVLSQEYRYSEIKVKKRN